MAEEILGRFLSPLLAIGPKIPDLTLGLLFGYILIKILAALLKNALKVARIPRALSDIIISILLIVMWVVLFSELARQAGLGSLAIKISGSLLVLGLALANGASTITADALAGIFLARDKNFACGLRIKTGEIEGVIEKIDVRKTRIRDNKGSIYVVSNSKIDQAGWQVVDESKA
ncbi:MAG: mechanosensitive ion channel domain-containing protein [Patescibacteria group bacterium]